MRNLLFATGLGLCCAACTLPPEPAISSVTTTVPPDAPNCQDYTAQVTVDGSTQPIAGRACKQDDGTWRIVESVPGGSPTVALYTPPPVAYQAFYDPWLWGPPLGFSTGGFLFLDKHHHVHRFHDHAPFAPHHPSFNRHEGFQQPMRLQPIAPRPMAGPPVPRTPMGPRPIAGRPGGPAAPWIPMAPHPRASHPIAGRPGGPAAPWIPHGG